MPKMIETCTCSEMFSRKGRRIILFSFPKRLLIAITLVLIIAMSLLPAEARVMEHKTRHQRHVSKHLKITKEISGTPRRPKHQNVDIYTNVTDKVLRKLTNTKRFFLKDQKKLQESREYEDGNPVWLPKVNFVNIHDHTYSSRNMAATIKELRFKYLIPKLYRSMKEYQRIFEILINVTSEFEADLSKDYKNNRWLETIRSAYGNLSALITEIGDRSNFVKMNLAPFEKNQLNLRDLLHKIDTSQCLKNNYLAFRGYSKLLTHWYAEFKCSKFNRVRGGFTLKPIRGPRYCREYDKWLQKRKINDSRRRRTQ